MIDLPNRPSGSSFMPGVLKNLLDDRNSYPFINLFQVIILALFFLCFFFYVRTLGMDDNLDFRNYHLYDGYAAVNGRIYYDIDPAQMQTYLCPILDVISYEIISHEIRRPKTITFLLSIPYIVSAFLLFRIISLTLPKELSSYPELYAAACCFLGCSGCAALPVIGTTMSDMTGGVFFFSAILMIVYMVKEGRGFSFKHLILSGFLFGVALAVKLIFISYFLGFGLALFLISGRWWERFARCALFGTIAFTSFSSFYGYWCLTLWNLYRNPMFPMYNQFFHSPYGMEDDYRDGRFFPPNLLETIFYPFYWVFSDKPNVCELTIVDPRFMAVYIGIALLFVTTLFRFKAVWSLFKDNSVRFIVLLFIGSYAFWEKITSYYRYLAALEFLTGVVLLLSIWLIHQAWLGGRLKFLTPTLALIVFGTVFCTTKPADWGHIPDKGSFLSCKPNVQVAPNTLILTLTADPISFTTVFFPPSVRWVGTYNSFVTPDQGTKIVDQINSAIKNHQGPILGVYMFKKEDAQPALDAYHLTADWDHQVHYEANHGGFNLVPIKRQ